jgi:hypothetical protein
MSALQSGDGCEHCGQADAKRSTSAALSTNSALKSRASDNLQLVPPGGENPTADLQRIGAAETGWEEAFMPARPLRSLAAISSGSRPDAWGGSQNLGSRIGWLPDAERGDCANAHRYLTTGPERGAPTPMLLHHPLRQRTERYQRISPALNARQVAFPFTRFAHDCEMLSGNPSIGQTPYACADRGAEALPVPLG